MDHSLSVEPLIFAGKKGRVSGMDEAGNFDVGVAGSVTMIILTLATTALMINFYRRYKRLTDRKDK
jgi:hypothetical protein